MGLSKYDPFLFGNGDEYPIRRDIHFLSNIIFRNFIFNHLLRMRGLQNGHHDSVKIKSD